MKQVIVLSLSLVLVCLLAACGDDDHPAAPEGPQGRWVENTIGNWQYQDIRFFRLDLPPWPDHEVLGYAHADLPGRDPATEFIDLTSIRVYRNLGSAPAQSDDITYAAAILDTTGRWSPELLDDSDPDDWIAGWTWRPLDLAFLRDHNGDLVAVDLGQSMREDEILAVVYQVFDSDGNPLYTVGDHPELGGERGLDIEGQGYYRFKLLKPQQRDPFSFQYALRNIYDLNARNVDAESFDLRIEYRDVSIDTPTLHGTHGLTYLRLFGLDRESASGEPGADGVVDKHRNDLFDLQNGLLRFPLDFPFPFDADEETYRSYSLAAPDEWEWSGTHLAMSIEDGVEFYDWRTRPSDYPQSGRFRFVVRQWVWDEDQVDTPAPDRVTLDGADWVPASLPQAGGVLREGRAADLRWFAPRSRVLRRLLEPDLEGTARDETEPALELAVNPAGQWWRWTGVMTGFHTPGLDLTKVNRLEIWINDFDQSLNDRRGTLHVDLGTIDEDFQWRRVDGGSEYGTFQLEDVNRDGIFTTLTEDVGLDAVIDPQTYEVIRRGAEYDADEGSDNNPYPHINNTAGNNREDTEDLDGDTRFNTDNRYLSWSVDLAYGVADVDVARDHPDEDLMGSAWRKYVLLLADGERVDKYESEFLERFSHLRIWIEIPGESQARRYQVARLRFR